MSYRGRPVAGAVLADDERPWRRVSLPFAGGELDPKGFEGSAYVAAGAAPPAVATLVVVRQPRLSDLERKALDRLPREMPSMSAGRAVDPGTTVARLVELRAQLMAAGRLS